MAKRRHRGGGDSLLRQARLETQVRYGPEKRALAELLHEARSDLRTGLAAEAGAADGIKAAVTAAQPELTKHYAAAHGDLRQADAQLKGDLSTLSASADPYRAVAAREAAAARGRLDDALARAQGELVQRKVGAEQGRAYGARNQLAQYQQSAEKIHRQKTALAAEEGTFTHATLGDLRKAKAEADFKERQFQETQRSNLADEAAANARLDLTQRGQDLSHQDRQAAARRRAAGKTGKAKFTTVQLRDARAQFRKGLLLTNQGKPKRSEGNDFVSYLTGKGIPEPIARAAVQTHLFGGVRAETQRLVFSNYGIKPKVMRRKRSGPPAARKAFPVFYGR